MTRRRDRSGEAGFTLVEVIVGAVIGALVSGVAIMALLSGNRSLGEDVTRTTVDDAAAQLMSRIVTDLRQTGPDMTQSGVATNSGLTLAQGASATTISFKRESYWDASAQAVVWGSLVTYAFVPAGAPIYTRAEIDGNGRDDNGNGLVDEGYVTRQVGSGAATAIATNVLCQSIPNLNQTWTTTPAGSTMTALTSGMWSQGFRFERGVSPNDDRITVTVTIGGRLGDGSVYARQLQEVVLLRN